MDTVCGLNALKAAKMGSTKGNHSYPKEDELSAILICLLQICYF